MAYLSVSLLGPIRIGVEGHALGIGAYLRVRLLLAYLMVEAERPQQRDTLATLLWPEHNVTAARTNLRQALTTLRDILGDRHRDSPLLYITRETIQFNTASDYTLDVSTYTTLLKASMTHIHESLETCPTCLQQLEQAVALYQGEFLQQCPLSDSFLLEEWALLKRDSFHHSVITVLTQLLDSYTSLEAWADVRRIAWRYLELVPWHEETYRRLMYALYRDGERSAALGVYERCRKVLLMEFGVEPSAETNALYRRIRI